MNSWRRIRKAAGIATDVLGKLPMPGDGPLTLAVKALAIFDSFSKPLARQESAESVIERMGGGKPVANSYLVELFATGEVIRSAGRVSVNEYEDVVYADAEGGRVFFSEWHWGGPAERGTTLWHGERVDLRRVLNRAWEVFGGTIHVELRSNRGERVSPAYSTIPKVDELTGALANKLNVFVAKQRLYAVDEVPRTYLFEGPQGVGKTTFALLAAKRLGGRLLRVGAAGLQAKTVTELDQLVDALDPDFILVDDIDKVDLSDALPRLLTTLAEMHVRNRGVVIVLTANEVGKFDPSMIRPGRVDERIEFGPPGLAERAELLHAFGCNEQKVAEASEGLTAAYLIELAIQARYEPVNAVVALAQKMADRMNSRKEEPCKKPNE